MTASYFVEVRGVDKISCRKISVKHLTISVTLTQIWTRNSWHQDLAFGFWMWEDDTLLCRKLRLCYMAARWLSMRPLLPVALCRHVPFCQSSAAHRHHFTRSPDSWRRRVGTPETKPVKHCGWNCNTSPPFYCNFMHSDGEKNPSRCVTANRSR